MSGTFLVGNTCAKAKLDLIEYADEKNEELVATFEGYVPVTSAFTGCGDALTANEYRLSFIVTPLPDSITGRERDAQGDTHSMTRTL